MIEKEGGVAEPVVVVEDFKAVTVPVPRNKAKVASVEENNVAVPVGKPNLARSTLYLWPRFHLQRPPCLLARCFLKVPVQEAPKSSIF